VRARRRLFAACLAALLAGALYVWRQPVLERLGEYLIAAEPPHAADAIVVLAGSTPDRILEAVDLYKEGYAPLIALTQGSDSPGIAELRARGGRMEEPHELNRSIAVQLGVPPEAVHIVKGGAGGTLLEARAVLQELRRIGVDDALIVTSKMHTRRASWIYRAVAGEEMRITTCAARHDPYDPSRWWHSRGQTRRVVIEYQKLLIYLLRDSWRTG
jgi:uncharacterized SAM-binding protein YcdF (DUF218 family)